MSYCWIIMLMINQRTCECLWVGVSKGEKTKTVVSIDPFDPNAGTLFLFHRLPGTSFASESSTESPTDEAIIIAFGLVLV